MKGRRLVPAPLDVGTDGLPVCGYPCGMAEGAHTKPSLAGHAYQPVPAPLEPCDRLDMQGDQRCGLMLGHDGPDLFPDHFCRIVAEKVTLAATPAPLRQVGDILSGAISDWQDDPSTVPMARYLAARLAAAGVTLDPRPADTTIYSTSEAGLPLTDWDTGYVNAIRDHDECCGTLRNHPASGITLAPTPPDAPDEGGITQRAHVPCCWCGEHHEEGN